MPFKKGVSGNPKGKPAGSKHQKTLEWEALGEALVSKHSERANKVLASLDDEKFLDAYGKLLEYFKPKQSRQEVKQDGTHVVEVVINRSDGSQSNTT